MVLKKLGTEIVLVLNENPELHEQFKHIVLPAGYKLCEVIKLINTNGNFSLEEESFIVLNNQLVTLTYAELNEITSKLLTIYSAALKQKKSKETTDSQHNTLNISHKYNSYVERFNLSKKQLTDNNGEIITSKQIMSFNELEQMTTEDRVIISVVLKDIIPAKIIRKYFGVYNCGLDIDNIRKNIRNGQYSNDEYFALFLLRLYNIDNKTISRILNRKLRSINDKTRKLL